MLIYSYERVDLGMKSRHRVKPEKAERVSDTSMTLESGDRLYFSHDIDSGQTAVYANGMKKIMITGREECEEFDESLYEDLCGTNQIFTR